MKSFLKIIFSFSPFLISTLFFLIAAYPAIINPTFGGDSGIRLDQATHLIPFSGPRKWLPFLQFHIFILYHLHAPLFAFVLIPMFYFILFLFLFNAIGLQIIGCGILEMLLMTVFLFVLTNNWFMMVLGTQLYQEILVLTLFMLLFYSYLKRNFLAFFTLLPFALLTREYFWIMYGVLGLLSFRSKKNSLPKIYWFFSLIPIIWLFLTKQPIWLSNSLPHPQITAAIIWKRISDFAMIFQQFHFVPIASFIGLIFPFLLLFSKRKMKDKSDFSDHFFLFTCVTILFLFGYIFLADPWQITPNNPRAVFPFFLFLPILILILWKNIQRLPFVFRFILLFAFLRIVLPLADTIPDEIPRAPKQSFYEEIPRTVGSFTLLHPEVKNPRVGVKGIDEWNVQIPYLAGPLLYIPYTTIRNNQTDTFDIVLTPSQVHIEGFSLFKTVDVYGNSIDILFRTDPHET